MEKIELYFTPVEAMSDDVMGNIDNAEDWEEASGSHVDDVVGAPCRVRCWESVDDLWSPHVDDVENDLEAPIFEPVENVQTNKSH